MRTTYFNAKGTPHSANTVYLYVSYDSQNKLQISCKIEEFYLLRYDAV
jgi:hypothetical protein